MSIPRTLTHLIQTLRRPHPVEQLDHAHCLIELLDESDPIERAFQALVILHPENLGADGMSPAVHDALHAGAGAAGDALSKGTRGTSHGGGELTRDGAGGGTLHIRHEAGHEDGTRTVYDVTVTVVASESNSDDLWGPGGLRDADDPATVLIAGHRYHVLADVHPRGLPYSVEFYDGRGPLTTGLVHHGVVPPAWHHRHPDNGRLRLLRGTS